MDFLLNKRENSVPMEFDKISLCYVYTPLPIGISEQVVSNLDGRALGSSL